MAKQRDAEDPGESNVGAGGGGEPLEEVGPEECAPSPTACEFKAGSLEENPDASHPKFSEEVLESFVPEPDLMVPSPIDGLPEAADANSPNAYAPPFTFETVVCVEDDREWVEMFISEAKTNHAFGVCRDPYDAEGHARTRLRFPPDRVVQRWGQNAVLLNEQEAAQLLKEYYIEVRPEDAKKQRALVLVPPPAPGAALFVQPQRPRCVHYQRQVFSNDGVSNPNDPGHKIIFRNCTARRSVGGAHMSLRDEAVYACSFRDPPDPTSMAHHLDVPDAKRLRSDAHLHRLPIFGDKKLKKD